MFVSKKFSPKTYDRKKLELDKWVAKEKIDIEKYKKEMEKGRLSTTDTI